MGSKSYSVTSYTRSESAHWAASRGYASVAKWMADNRKAWREFNARTGAERDRVLPLMAALDREYDAHHANK